MDPKKGSQRHTIAFTRPVSKWTQKGSRRLTIAGACSCVSGLGLLLLLPKLELDVDNGGKDGSEMLAAAVPALLGVGDGLINLQVLLFLFPRL